MIRALAICSMLLSLIAVLGVADLAAHRIAPPPPPAVDPSTTSVPIQELQQQVAELKTQIQDLHDALAAAGAAQSAHSAAGAPDTEAIRQVVLSVLREQGPRMGMGMGQGQGRTFDPQMLADMYRQRLMNDLQISAEKAQPLAAKILALRQDLRSFMQTGPAPQEIAAHIEADRTQLMAASAAILSPDEQQRFTAVVARYLGPRRQGGPGGPGAAAGPGGGAPGGTPPGPGAGPPPPRTGANF